MCQKFISNKRVFRKIGYRIFEFLQYVINTELVVIELPLTGVLIDFSLTVKAATLIFISWRGSANSPAKEEKSGFIYNLQKN